MPRRAKVGASLDHLLCLAIPLCRQAQARCPRTGPGRKPTYDDWKIAAMIVCGVLKKRKRIGGQFRLIRQNAPMFLRRLEMDRIPSRSTFYERYKEVGQLVAHAIRLQGRLMIARRTIRPGTVAVDKSLVHTLGPEWNQKDRKRGFVHPRLRGLDREADWGVSGTKKWVYGYSYEVVVTATRGSTVCPILASSDVASANEHTTFLPKARELPPSCRDVLADSGYDGKEQINAVEGGRIKRRFICPLARPPGKYVNRGARERRRVNRTKRQKFMQSRYGSRLYHRRACTVEPFNGTFKTMFELDEHTWHRGLKNNQTQMLAAIFAYQLLIRAHRERGGRDAQVQYLLDGL